MGNGRLRSGPPILHPATITATLVEATSRALTDRDCADLGHTSWSTGLVRPLADDARRADPSGMDEPEAVRLDAVAQWIVDEYPARSFPAVIIGSPHGSAAHLAAAMGSPWLPSSFEITVARETGYELGRLIQLGRAVGASIARLDPTVHIRQVCDPVRHGDSGLRNLHYQLAWRRLPDPYRRFLDARLRPGGHVILIRDDRRWPALGHNETVSFQIGSPAVGLTWTQYYEYLNKRAAGVAEVVWQETWSDQLAEQGVDPGLSADLGDWARTAGREVVSIGYACTAQLSAAVADIYRAWLRSAGKTGNRLIVECGRLIDPHQVLQTGLVPYWCEGPTTATLTEAELWVGASEPFTLLEMLPEPTGCPWPRLAPLSQWEALGRFATRQGTVDERLARSYPLRPLAPKDATETLRSHPHDRPRPPALRAFDVIGELRRLAMNHPASPVALSLRDSAGPHGLPQPPAHTG